MKDSTSRNPARKPASRKSQTSTPSRKPRSALNRRREALRVAEELYKQRPDWVTFFREMFGVGGVVPRLFPSRKERASFDKSREYAEIEQMIVELRNPSPVRIEVDDREPIRMITVRLPKSMHKALLKEAASYPMSMNKLCIVKLIRALDVSIGAQKSDESSAKE